jgi:hypothetical protein
MKSAENDGIPFLSSFHMSGRYSLKILHESYFVM